MTNRIATGSVAVAHRLASCSCGQLTVSARGEPVRVSICHCLACQQRTGSAFGAQARFPADAVTVAGRSTEYVRVGDEGGTARFHFCPACGATVFFRLEAVPDVVAVPVGAFADPEFPPPRVSIYGARRHRWVQLDESIEQLD